VVTGPQNVTGPVFQGLGVSSSEQVVNKTSSSGLFMSLQGSLISNNRVNGQDLRKVSIDSSTSL
jgi:hypothetical protein